MAAVWISDGTDVPAGSVPLRLVPRSSWRIGPYEFARMARAESGPGSLGRWGCCYRNSRGIACCRSPLGALIGLRRSMRHDVPPGPRP